MTEEVAAMEPAPPPGPLRRALFQDVPYILDSLWRWTEFRANRIGTVDFQGEHRFILRPAWQCGAFVLFALMCVFAIFGPTWDALCSLRGIEFATEIRNIASLLLYVVALYIFTRVLNGVTYHLTRRAEQLATEARPEDSARDDSPFANLAQNQAARRAAIPPRARGAGPTHRGEHRQPEPFLPRAAEAAAQPTPGRCCSD